MRNETNGLIKQPAQMRDVKKMQARNLHLSLTQETEGLYQCIDHYLRKEHHHPHLLASSFVGVSVHLSKGHFQSSLTMKPPGKHT